MKPYPLAKHIGGTLHLRNDKRASAAKRGYGRRHQRWRALILARDPVCRCIGHPGCEHEARDCGQASTQADHVDGDNQNLAAQNGQGMCAYCHTRKTKHDPKGETYRGLREPHTAGCDVQGIPRSGWYRPMGRAVAKV